MDSDDTVSLRAPSMDRELDTSIEEVPMDSSTLGLSTSSQQAPSVPSFIDMSSSSTLGLDINQSASNMLLSQPATPIICGNVTYPPIWIPFKSDSLPASSPSFSLAPGPAFQTATTLNSENLRQHFQAPSIQPPPGIPSPFPIVPQFHTSVQSDRYISSSSTCYFFSNSIPDTS